MFDGKHSFRVHHGGVEARAELAAARRVDFRLMTATQIAVYTGSFDPPIVCEALAAKFGR